MILIFFFPRKKQKFRVIYPENISNAFLIYVITWAAWKKHKVPPMGVEFRSRRRHQGPSIDTRSLPNIGFRAGEGNQVGKEGRRGKKRREAKEGKGRQNG